MQITIIAATGKSRQLGLKGDIPWRLPEDLKNFKKMTMGHHILMGRKTYESLGKPLPGRPHIIISRTTKKISGCFVFPTVAEGIAFAKSQGETELFICGGSKIYEESLGYADFMYLTQVDYTGEADAFFPQFDSNRWEPIFKTAVAKSKAGLDWCLCGFKANK